MANYRRAGISHVFDNLRKGCYDAAERRMVASLPAAADDIHSFVREKMAELGKSDMTGNYINGWGIAVYRDGVLVACATTNDIEGASPMRMTLIKGEKFAKGKKRYDGGVQERWFTASTGKHSIWAEDEVVRWLQSNAPRVSKNKPSLAYRIVTVVEYSKLLGGDKVLLSLADRIESKNGTIKEFRFA